MAKHNDLGTWGEDQAARFLTVKGHRIVARNYRCRFGEIDIIAEDDEYLIFVEVKVRKTISHGQPEEYVDYRKQAKLRTTAELYLQKHAVSKQPRFDVIAIYAPDGIDTYPIPIKQIKNAF